MRLGALPNKNMGWEPGIEILLKPVSVHAETQGSFWGTQVCQLHMCLCAVNTGKLLCWLPWVRLPIFVITGIIEDVAVEAPWGLWMAVSTSDLGTCLLFMTQNIASRAKAAHPVPLGAYLPL